MEPIIFFDNPPRVIEGNYLIFTVRLSEAATDAVTVDYNVMPQTAGRDDLTNYSSSPFSGSVTFAVGETVKTIAIYAQNEANDEQDEAFLLELRDPVNAGFGGNIHSLSSLGWVLDNDGAGNNQAIAVSNPVVNEAAGGKASFTISLSQQFATDRTFTYQTQDISGRAGSDYVGKTGTVTFLAGQTEAVVEVDLIDDGLAESADSFGLAITGAHGVGGAFGVAQILDDDSPAPVLSIEGDTAREGDYLYFTVRLSEAATDAVTVDYNVMPQTAGRDDLTNYSSSPFSGSVTFAVGETVKTIAIYAQNEANDEQDEAFLLELRDPVNAGFGGNIHSLNAIGWIQDNDGPGNNRAIAVSNPLVNEAAGGKARFIVSLSEAATASQTFSYKTQDGDAKAGSDYVGKTGTITFLVGQTEAMVEVDLVNDSASEANESFSLVITGAHGLNGAVGTARIQDPDSARPILSIEGDAAPEGDYLYFTVRLSEPAADAVTVDYAALPKSAAFEDLTDYSSSPLTGTVTFAAGETVKTIPIYARSDALDELDEAFLLELRNPDGATFGGNATQIALGWIRDDDGPTVNRTVEIANTSVTEGPGGREAVFTIELSQPHSAPITLNYQTADGTAKAGSDYAARTGSVTFAAGQTRAIVTVPILNNLAVESPETFQLRISPPYPSAISARTLTVWGTATIHDGALRGTEAGETLTGTALADAIDGLGGNDRILGLGGNDILLGGAGNDTLDGGTGVDSLTGGTGNDHYVVTAGDLVVEAANQGTDTVQAAFSHVLGANLENLVLTGTAALAGTGNALANTLTGNAGANTLQGLGGNDLLRGMAGNDRLDGGAGNDVLDGGAGTDRLIGGLGNDRYLVTAGDVLVEAANQGTDLVQSAISWTLGANLENLTLLGAAHVHGTGNALANVLTGNAGNNRLSGAAGNDRLNGGAGNDTLEGGTGNDSLLGGTGADRLEGGTGRDMLYGGADAQRDVFVFRSLADSTVGSGRDQVFNFVAGRDDIDLSALDANAGRAGNQAFAFAGTTATANAAWYVVAGSGVLVRIDDDGDRLADMEIWLSGVSRLGAGDFLL